MTISFYTPDLADFVEGLSYTQIIIALEGAINTVVGLTVNDPNQLGYNQFEEEIRDSTVGQLEANADQWTSVAIPYEDLYDNLVAKLAEDISSDFENVELQVLRDEMMLASWVKVINHFYTPQHVLRLTMEFDYATNFNAILNSMANQTQL